MTTDRFPDRARVDARDKVLGRTLFAADVALPGLVHAMLVPAAIAKGRTNKIDTAAARRVPGVLRVFTFADFAGVKTTPFVLGGGPAGPGHQPMLDDRIVHRGQPVAMVVAETLEAAIEAAALIRPAYSAAPFVATLDAGRKDAPPPEPHSVFGDAAAARATATIDRAYHHPAQHQNPLEMISTTVSWADGELTIHEGTQNSAALKFGVAAALSLDPVKVHVRSPYLGGGFGQKNALQKQTVLVARAAMALGRPVKLVVPRAQLFHVASYRPASDHRIGLSARAGKLVAATYDAEQQNSHIDSFPSEYNQIPPRLYGIANWRGSERRVRVDTQPVGYMRAPHEHPASFAFESAIDEMAYELGVDPLGFRLANDTATDPVTGKPFSSRHLAECLRQGAARFGWARRGAVGTMTAKGGERIGWGVAAGCYKVSTSPVIARLRIHADGRTWIGISGHEMGQGIRTAIVAALLAGLDVEPAKIEVAIGDPDAAPQHLTAGSWGTASAIPAVREVAARMQAALDELAGTKASGNVHRRLARLKRPSLEVIFERVAPGQPPAALDRLNKGLPAPAGPEYPGFSSFSFIAHFVEVRVEPDTCRIRVPRVVSIVDCGRVVSPRTAASQVRGGVVWGLGAALREASEVDPRFGFVLNNDLADYVVPVNADIGEIEVGFVDRPDALNASGVKGVGEVAMVGVAAAIANAVFHATGRRLRRLPIRIEDLL